MVALTADLQAGDKLAMFFCRQGNAPLLPGVSLEQCAMKSDVQFERKALFCASPSYARACCVSMATATIVTQGRNA